MEETITPSPPRPPQETPAVCCRWPSCWAALAIAVPVILSLLPRQPRVESEPEDPHAGQVYVNDGANMVWLTPHKNLAVNPFTANDFTRDENGVLRYTGMSGTVRLGVDVSDYQSGTDWQQLARQGVDFAILRVGYRGYTRRRPP